MSDELIKLDVSDKIATVTLDDPDRKNALSRNLTAELDAVLDELEESDARCLELRGADGVFSAGGDLGIMEDRFESDLNVDREIRDLERTTSRVVTRLATFPLPTVARIRGPAAGAGAALAIACDLQFAREDAKIGFGFRHVGLAVDSGTSYLLPRLVGENVAKRLIFTGEMVEAECANDLGLVNEVYSHEVFEERVDELVDTIGTGPTVALRHSKRLLSEGWEKSIDQAAADEALAQGIALGTEDHREGVEAFFEDREPSFEGR